MKSRLYDNVAQMTLYSCIVLGVVGNFLCCYLQNFVLILRHAFNFSVTVYNNSIPLTEVTCKTIAIGRL